MIVNNEQKLVISCTILVINGSFSYYSDHCQLLRIDFQKPDQRYSTDSSSDIQRT